MRAIIFTGGTVRQGKFTQQAIAGADIIMAADSGARAAMDVGVFPSLVIGDFDSLDRGSKAVLEKKGCQFIVHSSAKDQTDTELAVRYAIDHQASHLTIIGGIEGDRLDHILANVFSVMDAEIPIKFVNGPVEAWIAKGPANVSVDGNSSDQLSLIPLTSEVTKVETSHLRYTLRGETLYQQQARGISNVLTQPQASVAFASGTLLFVHTAVSR